MNLKKMLILNELKKYGISNKIPEPIFNTEDKLRDIQLLLSQYKSILPLANYTPVKLTLHFDNPTIVFDKLELLCQIKYPNKRSNKPYFRDNDTLVDITHCRDVVNEINKILKLTKNKNIIKFIMKYYAPLILLQNVSEVTLLPVDQPLLTKIQKLLSSIQIKVQSNSPFSWCKQLFPYKEDIEFIPYLNELDKKYLSYNMKCNISNISLDIIIRTYDGTIKFCSVQITSKYHYISFHLKVDEYITRIINTIFPNITPNAKLHLIKLNEREKIIKLVSVILAEILSNKDIKRLEHMQLQYIEIYDTYMLLIGKDKIIKVTFNKWTKKPTLYYISPHKTIRLKSLSDIKYINNLKFNK